MQLWGNAFCFNYNCFQFRNLEYLLTCLSSGCRFGGSIGGGGGPEIRDIIINSFIWIMLITIKQKTDLNVINECNLTAVCVCGGSL